MSKAIKSISFIFLIIIVCFYNHSANAQTNYDYLFDEGQKYDEDRYANSIGSPLLLDVWAIGMVYSNTGEVFYPILINYNILDQKWEARNKDKIIALDPEFFWYIILQKSDNPFLDFNVGDSLTFIRGLLPKDENKYAQILYNGQHFKLIKSFDINTSKQTMNNEVQFSFTRYLKRSNYFIVFDSRHEKVKLDNKHIAEAFGKKEDKVIKYLEKNNYIPESEKEWVAVLKEIEKVFF